MAVDKIAFLVVDSAGQPKTNASPLFAIYRAGGVDRTPPTGSLGTPIPHLGGGMYGCGAPEADVLAKTAYLINTGAGAFNASAGTRVFGAVHPEEDPLFVQLFEDGASALWAGAAPTLPIWVDGAGAASAAPSPVAVAGAYLWSFSPSQADLFSGRFFRWSAPTGAFPQYPHGVAFYARTTGASSQNPAADLVEFLNGKVAGGVTLSKSTNLFIGRQRGADESPSPVVFVQNTGGPPPSAYLGNARKSWVEAQVQLYVRGPVHDTQAGEGLALGVYNLLQLAAVPGYTAVRAREALPIPFGPDNELHDQWTMNFECSFKQDL